jgi:hypothetical protein
MARDADVRVQGGAHSPGSMGSQGAKPRRSAILKPRGPQQPPPSVLQTRHLHTASDPEQWTDSPRDRSRIHREAVGAQDQCVPEVACVSKIEDGQRE